MKKILIGTITLYQISISPLMKQLLGVRSQCRFSPSCSEYTKSMILLHGVRKGVTAGIKQLSHCHPFARSYGNL